MSGYSYMMGDSLVVAGLENPNHPSVMEEYYSSLLHLKEIGMVIGIFKEVWKLIKSVEIYNVFI